MKHAVAIAISVAWAASVEAQDNHVARHNPIAPTATQRSGALPLAPSSQPRADATDGKNGHARAPSVPSSAVSVFASLGVVLGLFFMMAWIVRRGAPQTSKFVPSEVVEVLGRTPLAHRQHAQLLKIGNKMVLVAVTPSGADTITEITDPAEVDRLVRLCRATPSQPAVDPLRRFFQQLTASKAVPPQSTTVSQATRLTEDE
jgi:flagellar biogenesis protein FliO